MEIIISRIGSHAFLEFDKAVSNYKVVLINFNGKIIHKFLVSKKNFLLINNLKKNEKYTINIINQKGEIISKKKI